MKSFKRFTTENTISYGKLLPHDEAKIRDDDKIISYFNKTGLMKKYENMKHPDNEHTLKELLYLKDRTNNLSDDDLLFANHAETDEQEMYRKFAENLGIKIPEDFVSSIMKQTDPLLFYLKKYHNRARPEQFANAYSIPFQTNITHTALHPAYPSGHAFDSHIMEYFLKLLGPHHSDSIEKFCTKMRESRLDAGLHYPSDNEISKKLAQDVIKHNLITPPGV